MRRLLVLLIAIFGVAWTSTSFAWGDSGHRTVCEIAWRNLTPTTRAEVLRLLAAHPVIPVAAPRNLEFGWACTYPDNVVTNGPPRRSPEHFVNYARTTAAVTSQTGCGTGSSCVISAIAADFARLRTTSLPDKDRAEALIYLGHWFGDIHQPLHNSFADDLGGNEVNSHGLCTSKFHSTWDTCMLRQRVYGDVAEPTIAVVQTVAATWSAGVTDEQRAAWLSTAPWQWSAESYAITLSPSTKYCVMVAGSCQYSATQGTFLQNQPRTSVAIDTGYENSAMPIIQQRITQAGIRLAHYLNLALDPAYGAHLGT
jgi:hypothetical protein